MTKIFLDTANLEEIEEIKSWGILDGLTTNQKIFLNEKGCNFEKRAKEILEKLHPLPVSLEGPNDYEGIIKVAKEYSDWYSTSDWTLDNVVIKVPMLGNGDGLRAVKTLSEMYIKTNVTACMTLNQAFLAASAGATYVSLFYCRMKDWHFETHYKKSKKTNLFEDGKEASYKLYAEGYALSTISETMKMLEDFKTKLIIGSIRSPDDITKILTRQPDIITIPTKILKQMPFNEKTEATLKEFEEAWKEFKKAEKK